ncbi:MAG: UDP-N-acetylmuramate--L-alanine ligase [Burkholderiales bacterium]|nr:UDP-N-acetylmuramate--L-alanine ligase [Burkholderiales bacterium]MDE2504654.1 UDP-N-acetylmuramate--L-alanine ligase [Burkholderiales bacterium]
MNAPRPHDHFVGIGGAGMSAIAEVLHALGHRVSGSDRSDSAVARRLAALGIEVHIGHAAAQVARADRVVTSTAIGADNPEVVAARAAGIPVVARAVVLGELMQRQRGIAIAGTHGKTTTTSLVASALVAAGADPSYVIGGELLAAGSHARLGHGAWLVAEADESDASFLHLSPAIAVVTNIDADHMETYGHDLARLHEAFVTFIQRLPADGRAVVCSDDAGVRAVLPRIARPLATYGLGADADLRAVELRALPGAQMQFTARAAGRPDLPLMLNLAGEHNVRNALATLAVAREIGLPDAPVARALAEFAGVGRRFQRWGERPAADGGHYTLIDDYGHHPVEIAAVLAAARGAFPGRRLVLAFQPHRYTRTRDCLADFAAVLGRFDALLLTEVYAAGEAPIAGADGRALVRACGGGAVFVADIDALPAAIQATARDGDVVLTMGAGSIGGVPAKLVAMQGSAP